MEPTGAIPHPEPVVYGETSGRAVSTRSDDSLNFVPPEISRVDLVLRLKYLLILVSLTMLQYLAVGPTLRYVALTFFTSSYGNDDCEETPDSTLCRRGTSDYVFYYGVAGAAKHGIAWVAALVLGSFSDTLGRRPFFRIKAAMSILPIVALAMHVFFDITLWIYLIVAPFYDAFDINGVFLAFMTDIITDSRERSIAFGTLMAFLIAVVCVCLPVGFLPSYLAIVVSLVTSVVKTVYVFTVFPESSNFEGKAEKQLPGCYTLISRSIIVFGRNSFIFRMVLVLVISGLANAGLGATILPYLTAYMGFKKNELVALSGVILASILFAMVFLLGPLVSRVGEVTTMKISLASALVCTILVPMCSAAWHCFIVAAVSSGPVSLVIPLVSAIKSNLVAPDEQGIVQGALASIRIVAVASADLFFGWFYRVTTDDGRNQSRGAVIPAFTVAGVLAALALGIAWTLPAVPPSPPSSETEMTGLADPNTRVDAGFNNEISMSSKIS